MDLLAVLVGLAILVGLVGIIVPVLPGSLLIGVALLVWAVATASLPAWTIVIVALVLLAAGSAAGYVLTGRQVTAAGVPRRSIVVAGVAGIVGFFVIPVLGLVLFFALSLLATEYLRQRELRPALTTAWLVLRTTALGVLLELAGALTAASLWLVAVVLDL